MFNKLPPLKSLRAFEAAARHTSFTEAAKELSLTQGAISYQIRRLESKLNLALFHRSVRKVALTEAGQNLFHTTHRLFRELEDEIHRIAPGKDQLVLTISVSTYFVTRWLSKRLGNFINNNPGITLRLQHSVNDPDFAVEDVDIAIRWGTGNWPGVESECLIPSPMFVVCSPQLLTGKNPLKHLKDLRHQALLQDQAGNDSWSEWLRKAGLEDIELDTGAVIIDPNVRVQSAIDGHGLVLVNRLIDEDITAGRLVKPFDIELDGFGFHLTHTPTAMQRHVVQLFRHWLLEEAGRYNNPFE